MFPRWLQSDEAVFDDGGCTAGELPGASVPYIFWSKSTSIYDHITYMVVIVSIKSCKMKLRRTLVLRCPGRIFSSGTRRSLVSLVPWQVRSRFGWISKPKYFVKHFPCVQSDCTEKFDTACARLRRLMEFVAFLIIRMGDCWWGKRWLTRSRKYLR